MNANIQELKDIIEAHERWVDVWAAAELLNEEIGIEDMVAMLCCRYPDNYVAYICLSCRFWSAEHDAVGAALWSAFIAARRDAHQQIHILSLISDLQWFDASFLPLLKEYLKEFDIHSEIRIRVSHAIEQIERNNPVQCCEGRPANIQEPKDIIDARERWDDAWAAAERLKEFDTNRERRIRVYRAIERNNERAQAHASAPVSVQQIFAQRAAFRATQPAPREMGRFVMTFDRPNIHSENRLTGERDWQSYETKRIMSMIKRHPQGAATLVL